MDDGKKKSMAAMIVSARPPAKDDATFTSEVSGTDSNVNADMETGLNQASEEAIAAFEAKDPVALTSALKAFIEMCH